MAKPNPHHTVLVVVDGMLNDAERAAVQRAQLFPNRTRKRPAARRAKGA